VTKLFLIGCILVSTLLGSGCIRTIYVPPGVPVRLRQDVKGVKIWTQDKDKKWVASKMDLEEGWFCLSDPDYDTKEK
jgi:hypothetical protein